MATEYKLSYTASEINRKLGTVDEIKTALDDNYYTKEQIQASFDAFSEFADNVSETLTKKADLVDGKIPVEQLPDGISGGTSGGLTEVTWEDIKNKPFGEINQSIEWDGTPTDECIMEDEDEGVGFYKVSDTYCDAEALIGKTVNIFSRETNDIMETATITTDSIVTGMGENVFGIMVGEMPAILMLSEAGMVGEIEFSSAGAWFMSTPEMFVGFLEITQVEQLDKKFIPSEIGTWAGMSDKPFGETGFRFTQEDVSSATTYVTANIEGMEIPWRKVSEPYNGTLINAKIKMDGDAEIVIGVDSDFPLTELDSGSSYMSYVFNMLEDNETISVEELGITSLTIPEKGLYIIDGSVMEMTLEYFQSPDYGEIKQLDEKFIPDVFVKSANVGAPNGVATLDADGKVPASQLPDNIGGGSGSGSGVTSWNDLEDKPFGEEGFKIEWDGTPTSEFFNIDGLEFYKVSDTYIDAESLIGSTFNVFVTEDNINLTSAVTSDMIENLGENCFGIMSPDLDGVPAALITSSSEVIGEVEIPSAGVWFLSMPDICHTSYLEVIQIKKLDPKFIPNYFGETGFYTDCEASKATTTISIPVDEENFGSSEFRYLKFAEPIDGSIQGYLLSILADGEVMEVPMGGEEETYLFVSDTGSEYGLYVLNIKTDNETVNMEDFGLPIFTVAEAGLYVFDASLLGASVNYFKSPDYSIIKIDEKYLPEGLGGNIVDCPTYSGGYIIDANTMMVINYCKFLTSMSSNDAVFNIETNKTNEFVLSFMAQNVTSDNNIVINIVTDYNETADNPFISNLSVELNNTRELKNNFWYTVYCVYNESKNKWIGHMVSASADIDTSAIERQISDLRDMVNTKQSTSNLVTNLGENVTDEQYPSAKLLYDTKTQITDVVSIKQDKSNLVTSISSSSTDEQYPSARLLNNVSVDLELKINTKQSISNLVVAIDENSTDEQYPSAKLLFDIVGDCDVVLDEISALIGE